MVTAGVTVNPHTQPHSQTGWRDKEVQVKGLITAEPSLQVQQLQALGL